MPGGLHPTTFLTKLSPLILLRILKVPGFKRMPSLFQNLDTRQIFVMMTKTCCHVSLGPLHSTAPLISVFGRDARNAWYVPL